jgi:DNA-binding response OmpR family regulator
MRAGVQAAEVGFLQKPFSSAALAAKIREILEVGASRD